MSFSTSLQVQHETNSSKILPIKMSNIKRIGKAPDGERWARFLRWREQLISKKNFLVPRDLHVLSSPCNWESVCCPGNKYGKPDSSHKYGKPDSSHKNGPSSHYNRGPTAHQPWRMEGGAGKNLQREKIECHTLRPMFSHSLHHIRIFFLSFLCSECFKFYEVGIIISPTLVMKSG